MKLVSGEFDYGGMTLEIVGFSIAQRKQEKVDIPPIWPSPVPAEVALGFNLNHKDPVKRNSRTGSEEQCL